MNKVDKAVLQLIEDDPEWVMTPGDASPPLGFGRFDIMQGGSKVAEVGTEADARLIQAVPAMARLVFEIASNNHDAVSPGVLDMAHGIMSDLLYCPRCGSHWGKYDGDCPRGES